MSSSRVGEEAGEGDLGGRTVSMEDIEDIVVEEGRKKCGSEQSNYTCLKYSWIT